MPTPMPKIGEKKRSRMSSQATLALSMTRLTTMISWSSCSMYVMVDLSSRSLLNRAGWWPMVELPSVRGCAGWWPRMELPSGGKERRASTSRG